MKETKLVGNTVTLTFRLVFVLPAVAVSVKAEKIPRAMIKQWMAVFIFAFLEPIFDHLYA